MGLHLLGTVHHDPRGFQKLTRFLQAFQPDLILVELSPFGLEYRKAHQVSLQREVTRHLRDLARDKQMSLESMEKHPEIAALRRQLAIPFEYRASLKYAQAHRIPLVLTDSSPFSHEMISAWKELTSYDNLSFLLQSVGGQSRSTARQYRQARQMICGDSEVGSQPWNDSFPLPDDTGERTLWAARERQMADAVRDALTAHAPRHSLYIGGWWHLTLNTRIPTLRQLLHIDAPHCHLLD